MSQRKIIKKGVKCMYELVRMGRIWEINTKEDYEEAMKRLDGSEFCAEMSDDFERWRKEKAEIESQRSQIRQQAIEKGLIPCSNAS